jgi:hypothetical protein
VNAKTFAIIVAFLIVGFIVDLIRRQKMTFKYSLFWLSASGLTLFFAFYDSALDRLASMAGFQLTSNFIFFLYLAFVSALCLFLTVYINEQNSRTETLAQHVGILQLKIKELEQKLRGS